MDWEFDENMLLTYNNPVFVEQCKRRNKNFDELNTGWIKQRKLDEEDELAEDEDLDDFDEDFDEEDENDAFIDNPSIETTNKSSEESSDNSKKQINIEKPSMEATDFADIFESMGIDDIDMDNTSAVPPIEEKSEKPVIKLKIKPSEKKTDEKPKLKINIKPKN